MNNNKYTAAFFKKTMPEWKRKKDPFLTRLFYRPISFYFSSLCANRNISANTISFWSAILAIVTCSLFFTNNYWCYVLGGILCNVWLIMDCIDGNIARSVKKEAFGPFVDSMSSYILVALLCFSMSFASYFSGGVLIEKNCIWIVLVGILASISDCLMRLIYQKYKNTEKELEEKGVLKAEIDERQDVNQSTNWKNFIDETFGIGGILPLITLLGAIFNALDIVVLYCFCFYFPIAVVAITLYARKAKIAAKKFPIN